MTEAQKQFDDWLKSNYLFDTSNFIKDEADREKAKSSNPTWMAWHHQQHRIGELENKLKIAADALNVYAKSSQSVPGLAIKALNSLNGVTE